MDGSMISDIRRYHPFFRKLTFQGAGMLFKHGKVHNLNASQILYKEGSKGTSIYIILCGKVMLHNEERGLLEVSTPDQSIGEESILRHDTSSL